MWITLNIGLYFLIVAEWFVCAVVTQDAPKTFFNKLVVTAEKGLLKNPGLKNGQLVKKLEDQLQVIPVPKGYVWAFVVFGTESESFYDMDPKYVAEKTNVLGKPKAFVRYRLGFGGRNYLLVAGPNYQKKDTEKVRQIARIFADDCGLLVYRLKRFAKNAHLSYKLFFCADGNARTTYHGREVSIGYKEMVRVLLF